MRVANTSGSAAVPNGKTELQRGFAGPRARVSVPSSSSTVGVDSSFARSARLSTAADREERLWLWVAVIEGAAASEVAVNVILPCCVCQRRAGAWLPPSATVQGIIVLLLNLVGAFLEGFFKSTRLLSQTMRRTNLPHQLVFVTSQAFSEGFLNVVTSFPDIAGSGGSIVISTSSMFLGALYCLSHLFLGIIVYKIGRAVGWYCAQKHWNKVVHMCRICPVLFRGMVIFACCGSLLSGSGKEDGVAAHSGTARTSSSAAGAGLMPLDLSEPDALGIGGARIYYDEYVFNLPPTVLGLLMGMFMSSAGAVAAALFCSALFHERARPTARLVANFIAQGFVILARQATPSGDNPSSYFVNLKFVTSFCGALSAFSGTIGDVTDSYFGSAVEDNSLDKAMRQREWLPAVSALQNVVAHWVLTLAVMVLTVQLDSQNTPIVLQSHGRQRWHQRWVQEAEPSSWLSQLPEV